MIHALALPEPLPVPDPEVAVRPFTVLRSTLTRIDGWGPLAWKEILGTWSLGAATLVIEAPEWEAGDDDDERLFFLHIRHGLGTAEPVATADWLLRHAWATLLRSPAVRAWTLRPGASVRATNACWCPVPGEVVLRFHVRLPYQGMCLDARRLGRFLRALRSWAEAMAGSGPHPELIAHRRAVAIQRALRNALPARGLVGFLREGSRLPRHAGGGPAEHAEPLVVPQDLAVTIDLGRLGRHRGLGIRTGVTALAGAPYHGKSTLVQALQAGAEDHPPGDGREGVVAVPQIVPVQAEDGRRVTDTDLSSFFRALPGAEPGRFTTRTASGATSMAATVVQGMAAGARLLLIDEDSAASNLLVIDPGMRRLLGRRLGVTTLLEVLPSLVKSGVSTVLVAGSSTASLAVADQVLVIERFQPREATKAARRITPRHVTVASFPRPVRRLAGDPDAMFGPRHFLRIDTQEPERPTWTVDGVVHRVDLRRSGFTLDGPLVVGAILAAAWCCRLAAGGADLGELEARYAEFLSAGPTALDPFHASVLAVPPWPLVAAVIERLPLEVGQG